jgi:hypothetical protein
MLLANLPVLGVDQLDVGDLRTKKKKRLDGSRV